MSEVPNGWVTAPIGDLVTLNPKNQTADDTEAAFIPMNLLGKEYRSVPIYETRMWAEIKSGYVHFKNDDVLLAKITPCFENGKAGIVRALPNGLGAGSTEYFVCRPHSDSVHPKYLLAFLKTPSFLRDGAMQMTGSVGHKRVPKEYLLGTELPLAPFSEQRRIAAKLDTLLARIDACRDRLDRLPSIIKQFRQSVLAAATSGKLTGEWREKNQLAKMWEDKSLSTLTAKITDGEHITPKRSPSGKFLLSARNIQNGSIALGNVDYVDDVEFDRIRRRCDPKIGDVLLSCSGSVGRAALVDRDNYYVMVRSAAMIRPRKELLHPTYLMYCLQSPALQAQIKEKSSATAQANIFLGAIKGLVLPVPELPEQSEIVRRVEALFAFADRIEVRVSIVRTRVDTLTSATLAKAFRGELVLQDPNDEPASVLLERIRSERSATPTPPRTRSTSRAK